MLFSCLSCLLLSFLSAQNIYIVNDQNQLFSLDEALQPTLLFEVDINEFGYLLDLAFTPEGTLYATTASWTLIEIDLLTQQSSLVASLPSGTNYPGLVADGDGDLILCRQFTQELYRYDVENDTLVLIDEGISTPGDFTYYKGYLIYPNLFNDFIKAYDGDTIINVGCSVPLIYGFVNDLQSCAQNRVLAFDEDSRIYEYDIDNGTYQEIADIYDQVGITFGAATLTEYQASACTQEQLISYECDAVGLNQSQSPVRMKLRPNPVMDRLILDMSHEGPVNIRIFDDSGRMVTERMANSFPFIMDVNGLDPGLYLIQCATPDHILTERIIKH